MKRTKFYTCFYVVFTILLLCGYQAHMIRPTQNNTSEIIPIISATPVSSTNKSSSFMQYEGEWGGYYWLSNTDENLNDVKNVMYAVSLLGNPVKIVFTQNSTAILITENMSLHLSDNGPGSYTISTLTLSDYLPVDEDNLAGAILTLTPRESKYDQLLSGSITSRNFEYHILLAKFSDKLIHPINMGGGLGNVFQYDSGLFPAWIEGYNDLGEDIRGIFRLSENDMSNLPSGRNFLSYTDLKGIEKIKEIDGFLALPVQGDTKAVHLVQFCDFNTWVDGVNLPVWHYFIQLNTTTGEWVDVSYQFSDFYRDEVIPYYQNELNRIYGDDDTPIRKGIINSRNALIFTAQSLIDGHFFGGDAKQAAQFAHEHF